ncbi:HesA/MoeB/ThiF family protein [Oceanococcus atlanticus]|uniref:HesA/MoeB/ThiF family protein n=1 Tax=Oceanococcus atlanticus TaxID=1317117 RepID=UPI0013146F60|nr:ThiF family adenylyltransferase [Oceanococcus atlanticus]
MIDRRYSRQTVLDGLGEDGQASLKTTHVVIFGLGGVGGAAAISLAAAGVERLSLWDGDRVELSNLHRQTLYCESDIGAWKADCAAARIRAVNSCCEVHVHAVDATSTRLREWEARSGEPLSLVIDATDNPVARKLVSTFALRQRLALISAAAIGWHGQISCYRMDLGAACDRCAIATRPHELDHCEGAGVAGPVPAVIGGLAATAAINVRLGAADQTSTLMTWDARAQRFGTLQIPKRSACECALQQARLERIDPRKNARGGADMRG